MLWLIVCWPCYEKVEISPLIPPPRRIKIIEYVWVLFIAYELYKTQTLHLFMLGFGQNGSCCVTEITNVIELCLFVIFLSPGHHLLHINTCYRYLGKSPALG